MPLPLFANSQMFLAAFQALRFNRDGIRFSDPNKYPVIGHCSIVEQSVTGISEASSAVLQTDGKTRKFGALEYSEEQNFLNRKAHCPGISPFRIIPDQVAGWVS
ncbi:MAG: hypothetical protein VZR11_09140 [Succinimonas sp.]|nr:hypothetical protein [Succinimonas sp.]